MTKLRNTLWKPPDAETTKPPKAKTLVAPKNGFDVVVCRSCDNKGLCVHACAPLKWIDGNVPRREGLCIDIEGCVQERDYNDVLSELSEHYDTGRIEESIRAMPAGRGKAAASLLFFEFTSQQAASMLHISRASLFRLMKKKRLGF